jgi:indole-3-glycerol phosphate synthase
VGFLEDIVETTRARVERKKEKQPFEELMGRLEPPARGRPFSEALISPGVSLIAEMKRASPSQGPIRPDASVTEIVQMYEAAGASACSILTEPTCFGGRLHDLREAREACSLPLLRKDFIIDRYQLVEARLAGADAALLIVSATGEKQLRELLAFGLEIGLDLLVEVHDEEDAKIAVAAGAEIVGINNRDLKTLEVDPDTVLRLLPDIPAGTTVVAESGISDPADVRRLEEAGVDAILVGEALMRAPDPAEAVRVLLGR